MNEDKVTLRDIYDVVERVEDKMDRRFEAVERDISNLKAFQNRTLGVVSIFSGLVSVITVYIWNKITGQT